MQLLLLDQSDVPFDYDPSFLSVEEADWLYDQSLHLDWQQHQIRIFGKTLPVPRLETIYGESGCDYLYSGSVLLQPLPWTDCLRWLNHKIETKTHYRFHIAVGNRYRSGSDSISWHSDDEASMGKDPAISSVSLGATRKFSLKRKQDGSIQYFDLQHGSLLLMRPGCQSTHLHQVPKGK
ncbi:MULTISPECIES: alpha-ketoglutarate-dependent dioxygenase AlkB family protein [Leptolyngbya]|jgi:alkylated DNA repair dioxygenase AlkB|uniref:2OG-Fe(II) oxygenase n=1 Tax=Leptolyngbya boryana NIES-2135 TaxID=1973484 RepID=A0A1Z4J950_LEPBY|nr:MULTISPECIES: alpha-ketoglutarate-dependent dioxygenase AlkB [Leptolyngbya]BAY53289.1 2OG-Fe(II) oxygenase [Leptolyngbya boryana NIES-2135]MBD2366843.1 alpha-ketoglutarate-dependent dioxygenase AlkB [Leptolyngbya sp. FACHB-161]MBD2373143.1 alpha-ketoglutarate-dependent dioxygenase AlkB [Leptolyngbya sp. FACHB-238]MBD2397544.1 alpha-ketoglutarate-dependent dioxygenase AlkB [Leptolyngbya sp. FACHB-239]MBD2404688.1 alpha-ketoglutarate-dependent dioxygenase AlkB [Leptolyngbya sp. FACHB-402]